MKIDLNNKVAVVTGAAAGIGKAIGRLLCENGAQVVISDVNDDEGRKTEAELSQNGNVRYLHLDVSKREQVETFVKSVVDKFGRIDIFVNNAGVNISGKKRVTIDEFPQDEWDRILDVDLDGVFYCCRAVSKVMIEQKGGRIVNIGSVLGNIPARKQIAYVAAKGAVHNLTKGLALELAGHGILVNAVAPGSILTDATRELIYDKQGAQSDLVQRMLSHVPLGRPGDPDDIANAVLFFCGDESKYITGHVLTVDGGWTCGFSRDF